MKYWLYTSLFLALIFSFRSYANSDIWILIDTLEQRLSVMRGDKAQLAFNNIAIGRYGASSSRMKGDNQTPLGSFQISWIKQHRILPKRMLTPDEFPELPESNRNKAVPILYGNWLLNSGAGINKTGVASNLSPGASSIVYHDYFLGILNQPLKYGDVGTGADRPHSILCGHDVLQRSYPTPDGKLTRWLDEREIFSLTNIRHVQPAFGTVIDGVTADEVFKASNTLFRTTHLIPVVDVVGTSGATNPE